MSEGAMTNVAYRQTRVFGQSQAAHEADRVLAICQGLIDAIGDASTTQRVDHRNSTIERVER
jgi:hypothetical protein